MTHTLDVSALRCPMTWVRTKLELERLPAGTTLEVLLPPGEALTNVPRSAREAGHAVDVDGTKIRIVRRMSEASRRGFFRDAFQSAARAALRAEPEPEAPPEEIVAPLLTEAEIERYSRQLVLPDWSEEAQIALRDASVLVVGAGALGSPVALYLAGAGVGRVGLVDSDVVEISNLHRQPLHFTPDLGVPKVESAAAKLRFLNPDVVIEPYQVRLDETNAAGLVEGQDLVIDCSDSFATRYAVNTGLLRRGRGPRRGWRGGVERARDDDPAAGHRLLPLRVPRGARGHAVVRGGRHPRPGRGRARHAAGTRGDQAPQQRPAAAAGRVPDRRPRLAGVHAGARAASATDCPDCGG